MSHPRRHLASVTRVTPKRRRLRRGMRSETEAVAPVGFEQRWMFQVVEPTAPLESAQVSVTLAALHPTRIAAVVGAGGRFSVAERLMQASALKLQLTESPFGSLPEPVSTTTESRPPAVTL